MSDGKSEFTRDQILSRVEGTKNVIQAISRKAENLFGMGEEWFDSAYEQYYTAHALIRTKEYDKAEEKRVSAITVANAILINATDDYLSQNFEVIKRHLNGNGDKAMADLKKARELLIEKNQKEIGEICEMVHLTITKAIVRASEEAERANRMKDEIIQRISEFEKKIQMAPEDKREPLNQLLIPVMMGVEYWPRNYDLTVALMDSAEQYYEKTKRFYTTGVFSEKCSQVIMAVPRTEIEVETANAPS